MRIGDTAAVLMSQPLTTDGHPVSSEPTRMKVKLDRGDGVVPVVFATPELAHRVIVALNLSKDVRTENAPAVIRKFGDLFNGPVVFFATDEDVSTYLADRSRAPVCRIEE